MLCLKELNIIKFILYKIFDLLKLKNVLEIAHLNPVGKIISDLLALESFSLISVFKSGILWGFVGIDLVLNIS